ncbi:response regulator, partial [Poseidonibacter sp.]|uniref:response regulator n=1 Tax=Poseidonibacter sp. TaxID=2321188 RepID=UPI003C786282
MKNELIEFSKKLSVLFVKNNINNEEKVLKLFNNFFENVTVVNDGNEALLKYIQNDYDLVITDINISIINGLELSERIREINNKAPIIMMSDFKDSNEFISSIKIGVLGYIIKPIDEEQLNKQIIKIVKKIKKNYDAIEILNKLNHNLLLTKEYESAINENHVLSRTNLSGVITYVNEKFTEVSGYSKEELIGHNHNIIRQKDTP